MTQTNCDTVIKEIAIERARQMEQEGWTPEHNDEHVNGEMARAGVALTKGRRDGA